MTKILKIYVDGSCMKAKDGKAITGVGIVAYVDNIKVLSMSKLLDSETNNEAEYMAIYLALVALKSHIEYDVEVYSDSALVVNQLNGKWKINYDHLHFLNTCVKKVMSDFPNIKIEWIRREQNSEANDLAQGITKEYKKCQQL